MSGEVMIDIYADGADLEIIRKYKKLPFIKGFTTNPTLMRNAGVKDYKQFALNAISIIGTNPISFEVFADDFNQMETQAEEIASWGDNVNVKIPITNTKGESSVNLIESLVKKRVKLNITAIMTLEQVKSVAKVLSPDVFSITSVFCGRIADTGIDPVPMCKKSSEILAETNSNLLWASPREILNIKHAENSGCKIITITDDILKKYSTLGKDLNDFSLDTVKMFYSDALNSGFSL